MRFDSISARDQILTASLAHADSFVVVYLFCVGALADGRGRGAGKSEYEPECPSRSMCDIITSGRPGSVPDQLEKFKTVFCKLSISDELAASPD